MSGPHTVLVVEDSDATRSFLEQTLESLGYEVACACSIRAGIEVIDSVPIDLAFLDLKLGTRERGGQEVLAYLQQVAPDIPGVVITADDSARSAVEVLRQGAYDYVVKPVKSEDVERLATRGIELREARRALTALRAAHTLQGQEWDIGNTPRMRAISEVVASCAPESVSVLIQGDTGTGKEVVARAIHARSPRADGAFVAINCAALPENLLESELFGHEKGAFTDAKTLRRGLLELGHGGTVFLDEVTMMSPAMQAKLLRALQDRKIRRIGGSCELNIDIRVLAAANVDVVAAIAEGTFREDLYYRLAVFTIELPPLKDRRVDIPMFVDKFLKELHSKHQVSDAALAAMTEYQWPGNIRELRNVIERAVIVAAGEDTLDMHHLPQAVREAAVPVSTNGAHPLVPPGVTGLPAVLPEGGLSMKAVEHAWEQDLVEQALERTDGNQTRAATLLGLTRDELRYRVEKFRLAGDPDQED